MHIISASRRTDIPAFYMPWFMRRLDAGMVSYPNPFGGQRCTVSLRPEHVHSFVFWSKNFAPFLPHLDAIRDRDTRFYCHYTITGAPRFIEPHVPDWEQGVDTFRALVEKTSPRHVQWRFDPILIAEGLPPEFYSARFRQIAQALSGLTERCYFSFASFYGKVERRLTQAGIRYNDPPLAEKHALIHTLADTAEQVGITLYACCQDDLIGGRVKQAHCVDGDLLAELFPDRPLVSAQRPTREACGCFASRDIGIYNTCVHGCVYCYANQSHAGAESRQEAHNVAGEMLVGT